MHESDLVVTTTASSPSSLLLQNNPYFTAGFGLLGVGAGLALLRQGITRLAYLLQRKYLTTVEVTSKDPAYFWLVTWLSQQALASGNHFTANARPVRVTAGQLGKPAETTVVSLSASPGIHYIRWRNSWLRIHREREKSALMDLTSGIPFETITISAIGQKRGLFMQLLCEAQSLVASQEQGKLVIYTSWAAEWRPFGNPRRKRPLDSVIFDGGIREALVADVREFLSSNKWYLDRGIPYRRGYLLFGPPGGGKSSFVQALASELDYSICLLNLSETALTDDRLNHLLNVLPERSILLLEDIDAAVNPVERPHGKLTFSGLLNALDGVASSEERLIFMTTNHYDRLDPALIRPGRIDYQQYIGPASANQISRMFSRFYPQEAMLAEQFASKAAPLGLSPAAIQGLFIQFKSDGREALEHILQNRNARE